MPKVSVVIPSYNSEKYLSETIDSVLNQSFNDYELIIVDSNSTDNTVNILQAYQDVRIKIIHTPLKCGNGIPRSLGYMAATGEYIANMDSDDLMREDRLLKQVNFLDANPSVDILGSNFTLLDGDKRSERIQPVSDKDIKANMLFISGNAIMNPTVMLRRKFVTDNNVYYPPLMVDADHAYWVECIKHGATFANLADDLLDYRVHTNNTTRSHAETLRKNKTPLRINLLGMYFTDLSRNECGQIAALMAEDTTLSLYELYGCIDAVDKALRMSVGGYRVDVNVLKNILSYFRKVAVKSIDAALNDRGLSPQ